jgi:hypothetical protein
LEAAPVSAEMVTYWSIVNTEIGVTAQGIGTGQSNTTAIINQIGHTFSAAKYCNDLVVSK